MGGDKFTVTVLDDGTIKAVTDIVSPANHMSADAFFRFLSEVCGTKAERKSKRLGVAVHSHGSITHSH